VAFVVMGAAAGLFFPCYYVTAAARMGDDPRVPPVIIGAGLAGGIGAPLLVAPLGPAALFPAMAILALGLAAVGLLALRRMGRPVAA
ncbi:MAG: hypothetical protein IE927_08475, partial [Rhodobacterales bacterium]|nr:hypothetical protein [Rhodobacterales bacterium]